MSFTEIDEYKFTLTAVRTWGVKKDSKYGGYTVPIVLDDNTASELRRLADKHNIRYPVRSSNTLYLKCKKLTSKQTKELLGQGRCFVSVNFSLTGVFTRDDNRYPVLKIKKLSKSADPEHYDSGSDCPED